MKVFLNKEYTKVVMTISIGQTINELVKILKIRVNNHDVSRK
jgi:pilus assembly protein TadC